MLPAWVSDYIGIPFAALGRTRDGLDCYGLVWLVLRERFGISAPSYAESYANPNDLREIGALIRGEIVSRWRMEPHPSIGDVINFNVAGMPCHVGIIVAPRWFLHVIRGADSCVEQWTSPKWGRRVEGFYRYAPTC